jgi:hypothetical protein
MKRLPPTSDDPALSALLRRLSPPGDNRSLAELAHTIHTTERTLMRRCQRPGHVAQQMAPTPASHQGHDLLEVVKCVETTALDLGCSGASAFIAPCSNA